MKKIIGGFVFVIIIGVLSVMFIPGLIDQNQSRIAAKSVLDNVINGDFEKAFESVYFWDVASDFEPEISYEDAEEKWVNRVKKLKENEFYIIDYSSLRVHLDDSYPVGIVDLIVMENRKRVIKKDVRLWFAQKEDTWKLGNFHSIKNEDKLLQALSGNMK